MLFEDKIVTSSDLNRRSGEILRSAEDRPVTIVRSSGDLVLMRRTLAADLIKIATACSDLLAICTIALSDRGSNANWAHSLELSDLARASTDVAKAFHSGDTVDKHLDAIRSVIYEWDQSIKWSTDADLARQLDHATDSYIHTGGIPAPKLVSPSKASQD